ncbi:folylpolyglutamate synthase/dihydrofolate synthase family protein [uncultured Planktosalinus sp.]|uniref:bifunctional folylpolyglutamate synthase/dihydrofolate synthase n=1 Tax=uncultured Planktosalinus sp. TaxID=1810935 RepID=UPI0030D7D9D1
MYQRVGGIAYKKDLSNTILLANYLENPQNNFKSIHVAGTNGKGSVSHMLASVLQEAGYKVGLYTSPHLRDFRERIKINGKMIPKKKVSSFIAVHKAFFEANSLSFFEMTVGLAFEFFSEEKVDIAVVEVGMGGRLDSTNIITPLLSIITNIGKDHTAFLGTTYEEIATEKSGIIKSGVPVIIGEVIPETKTIFESISTSKNAPILFAENFKSSEYPSDLKGSYQIHNKKTVLASIAVLRNKKLFNITEKHFQKGLLNVVKNTGLMGRWQELRKKPMVICDTAHNKEGLGFVLNQLKEQKHKKLHFVIGVVSDKDLSGILHLFPKSALYYFCKPDIPRGLDAEVLHHEAQKFSLNGKVYNSVKEAYKNALGNAKNDDLIFVGGSTFVVAEII